MSEKKLLTLIEAQKEYIRAKSDLEVAKLEATEYFRNSEYSEVNLAGYKLTCKKYKKQKIKESRELAKLRKELNDLEEALIKEKAKEIYEFQKNIFILQMGLDSICSNDMMESLQAKIADEEAKLSDSDGGKYDIFCKFNSKSAEEFLSPELVTNYVRKGWKLKKTCGKAITKTQVLKFLIDNKDAEDLEERWNGLVLQHESKL